MTEHDITVDRLTVHRVLDATPQQVFTLLSDPTAEQLLGSLATALGAAPDRT